MSKGSKWRYAVSLACKVRISSLLRTVNEKKPMRNHNDLTIRRHVGQMIDLSAIIMDIPWLL